MIAALHNFPGAPKRLIFDVVYGHSDNQGLEILPHHYFAGPNMYGQNVNYRNWTVRAILQEMQRRKGDYGADGIRVDGAQDFKWWDGDAQEVRHDDEYLQEMSDVVQEVAGRRYRPWFVFEDGRPWPQEDWELSSTYRAVIETQRDDDVFQWGPLTFAHNTPFLYTFWLSKWWRIRQIVEQGSNWISGCANHDTLRRGTQINPKLNINTRLGDTRMDILDHAYDNPAAQMLTYAAFPGVPMDFLNAGARASWGFIRNQDDKYGVKIMAEEAISLEWQVDEYSYSMPHAFSRMKALGYDTREDLRRFLKVLPALVEVTDYDLEVIAALLNKVDPPLVRAVSVHAGGAEDRGAGVDGRHARLLQRLGLPGPAVGGADGVQPGDAGVSSGPAVAAGKLRAAGSVLLRAAGGRDGAVHQLPPRAGRRAGLHGRPYGGRRDGGCGSVDAGPSGGLRDRLDGGAADAPDRGGL